MASDDAKGDPSTGWMEWLSWLRSGMDPLSVRGLLERCAQALDAAQSPAEASERVALAIDEERLQQQAGLAQFDQLLKQWSATLRQIAPILPDAQATDTPALGPYPQRQALLTALATESQHYQQALAAHLDSITTLAENCTAAFREDLIAQSSNSGGRENAIPPDTLVARWSAIAEPRYEAWLDDPQTQARIGALVNAWSALATTLRALVDDCLETLGLPSSRGLDDLANELQRQRRRQRQDIAALKAEIAELREQIDGGKS